MQRQANEMQPLARLRDEFETNFDRFLRRHPELLLPLRRPPSQRHRRSFVLAMNIHQPAA